MEIEKICADVLEYGFAAACVPPPWVGLAHRLGVRTVTVIGFPFGYSTAAAKAAEVEKALADGADELDVVINLVFLKDGNTMGLADEMRGLVERAHASGKLIKVIIETGVLADEEMVQCCAIYASLGVDFVKTSTGYAERGASLEAVRLMRANLPLSVRIKASGGIRDMRFARELVDAGAARLGCSAGVTIIRQERAAAAMEPSAVKESHGEADFY